MTKMIKLITKYWNNQPCNISHGKSPVGTIEYFDEVTSKRYMAEPHISKFADFKKYNNKKVLEIGCGIGTDSQEFAAAGAKFTATDISKESLTITQQRFNVKKLNGTFYLNDFLDDEFVDNIGEFDLVYSFGVLHHYPHIEKIIANIHKVLKPGGEFKFMVYAKHSWKNAMISSGLDQYEAQSNCPLANVYSKEEIYELLAQWRDVSIEQDHCFMYNIEEYKKGKYVLEPWFAIMGDEIKETIRKELGWHLLVRALK
jgi:SAM-dependent methyltransferase